MSEELDLVQDKLIVVYHLPGGVVQSATAVNLAAALAKQGAGLEVLVIDWGAGGEVAAALGIQATRGLYDWLHNEDRGGSRLGYNRFVQATPVKGLFTFSGHLDVADVRQETLDVHMSELMWASSFDYVVCDVPSASAVLGRALLKSGPGVVIIPVALEGMDVDQVRQAVGRVRLFSPDAQLILAPIFALDGALMADDNLALLQSLYPGAVTGRDDELVGWIQKDAAEILFGADV